MGNKDEHDEVLSKNEDIKNNDEKNEEENDTIVSHNEDIKNNDEKNEEEDDTKVSHNEDMKNNEEKNEEEHDSEVLKNGSMDIIEEKQGLADGSPTTDPDEAEGSESADVERIITSFGRFGPFQWMVSGLDGYVSMMSGMIAVASTFMAYQPLTRCRVPGCDTINPDFSYPYLNFSIPRDMEQGSFEECQRFSPILTNVSRAAASCQMEYFSNKTESCGDGYVYDSSVFRSTILTDFSLVCAAAIWRTLPGMLFMGGQGIGSIVIGEIADRHGRVRGMLVAAIVILTTAFISALSPYYWLFLIATTLNGAARVGFSGMSFIHVIESLNVNYRTQAGMLVQVPFAIGEAITGILAYLIRDWRYFQVAIVSPCFLVLLYPWIMPETLRWLVSKGRYQDAIDLVQRIRDKNGIKNEEPPHFLIKKLNSNKKFENGEMGDESKRLSEIPIVEKRTEPKKKRNLLLVFKYPRTRVRTLNLMFQWMACVMTYYGLSMNSSSIKGSIFVNYIFSMLIEIPSFIITMFVLKSWGRKGTMMFMYLLTGVTCIWAGLISTENWPLVLTLTLVGKFGAASLMALIYVYTSEVFPTEYRAVCAGACSTCGRIGGVIAPALVGFLHAVPWVVPVVFGLCGLTCAGLVLLLPETGLATLPQTLEESEDFGRDQKTIDVFLFLTKRKNRDEDNYTASIKKPSTTKV